MVATLTKSKNSILNANGTSGGNDGGNFSQGQYFFGDEVSQIGMLFFMATVTMLFGGVTSALLIRRASPDWQPIYVPAFLWINTAILLLSSATLEFCREALKREHASSSRFWITVTTMLGLTFLVGQIMAWQQMAQHGIFLPSNPHASFFYLLTGLHAVHLLGGLLLLSLACGKAWTNCSSRMNCSSYATSNMSNSNRGSATTRSGVSLGTIARALKIGAIYWHFMDALWLLLFFVLIRL